MKTAKQVREKLDKEAKRLEELIEIYVQDNARASADRTAYALRIVLDLAHWMDGV